MPPVVVQGFQAQTQPGHYYRTVEGEVMAAVQAAGVANRLTQAGVWHHGVTIYKDIPLKKSPFVAYVRGHTRRIIITVQLVCTR